ncbi:hypothetical protein [Sinomonas sp. P10A9]|uniref:Uncharacterized protein n=1 Tax=Sinomonas puerhi TaxID=3238584 RepID=A0AB39L6N5_9MICC
MTKLTITDLAAETVELLPSRETLTLDTNLAGIWASNMSLAANVDTFFSHATSTAVQGILVVQS